MSNPHLRLKALAERGGSSRSPLVALLLASPLGLLGCGGLGNDELAAYVYQCGTDPGISLWNNRDDHSCGRDDAKLPLEPSYDDFYVCETVVANKSTPDEGDLDTERIQAALDKCKGQGKDGGAVKLVADGDNDAFIAGHLGVFEVILWIDEGVTLYASRDPEQYQRELGNCGTIGVNDSSACADFISADGNSPGIIGEGTIDGQGGEPLVDRAYSWWEASGALRGINGSIGNPTMINALSKTTNFILYRVKLVDAPKFHVKISSAPVRNTPGVPPCENPGDGFIVWGVTILTPSKWMNSQGRVMTPQWARNTDGIDPGTSSVSSCGVIACNTITTGDDQIAIKGGHQVSDLIIAHNHFGTGHGISIGSETMGDSVDDVTGERLPAIENIDIYDLTIDADSRWVGEDPHPNDFNGIRIKSDPSRGGVVTHVNYTDICMRDQGNSILVSTSYNPLFSGIPKYMPEFGEITMRNVRGVTCSATTQTTVSINGYSPDNITGPVNLDNVVFDNIGPQSISSRYSDIVMGPGDVNFEISGWGTNVTDNRDPGSSKPPQCVFPTLPTPEGKPEDWVW